LQTIMKVSLKSIFGIKSSARDGSMPDKENLKYDKNVSFYYSNLINSIILFSLTFEELDKLGGPLFNPIFELESEIDYAFTPVLFETIFRNGIIDNSFKSDLLKFKQETDDIPQEIWDWDYLDKNETWILIRQKANELLDKLGIDGRTYKDEYTTVYNNKRHILKKL